MSNHYYIGISNSFHDTAIAIINGEGEVLYAEAAERPYQVKRAIGCAPDNIAWSEELIKRYCPGGTTYTIAKRADFAINKALSISGIIRFDLNNFVKRGLTKMAGLEPNTFYKAVWFFKNIRTTFMLAGASLERIVREQTSEDSVKTLAHDHHMSHAAFACYGSPFNEAVCLVADGEGDNGSFSFYRYTKGKILLLEKQKHGVSFGDFYSSLTQICGFDPVKGEEWKVMGLAAYGSLNDRLYQLFMSMYCIAGCSVKYIKSKADTKSTIKTLRDILAATPNDFSLKADIAYNGQLAYSNWMNELITNIHKKYPSDNLILVGGCALNSSYNGEILNKTPFKNLYVPSAPADDGCALGGALLAYYADHPHTESIHKNLSPYLGTEITEEQIRHFLLFSGQKVRKLEADKYETVARLLADGKIIGWVQGKAEYGPRALGNRSILADPRKKEIKDIINDRVKFREEFRPFAPSILHEYGSEYFEHYQESHYMERTLKFKQAAIDKVPGVVHVNNTGRLQTVKKEWNAELYHLLKAFHNITGVPVLLNTSFNVMGKPIIHTIEDALSTFFTTGIDALIINDYLIEK